MDETLDEILGGFPAPALTTAMIWEALVEIGPREAIGPGPHGVRAIVPITGGRFRGGPGHGAFHGTIPPRGADRQLLRADGAKELDAIYEMRVADGTLVSIRNRVILDDTRPGPRYALSRIEAQAPEGKWDWLNRRVILGTLQPALPARQAVVIRAFLVDMAAP
ncbi:MAG: DUF3237 family protein [Pseudooceanicola sp.]